MELRPTVAIVSFIFILTGCTSYSDVQPGYQEHLDSPDDYQQSEVLLKAEGDYYADQQRAADFATSAWRCWWDPTMTTIGTTTTCAPTV